jgi:PAS domain S-box-containing protein
MGKTSRIAAQRQEDELPSADIIKLTAASPFGDARLTRLLDRLPAAFYALDRNWRLLFANRKAEQFWGRSRGELAGCHFWEAFPMAVGSLPYEMHCKAAAKRVAIEFETKSPVTGRWIKVSITPIEEGLAVSFVETANTMFGAETRDALQRIASASDLLALLTSDAQNREILGRIEAALKDLTRSLGLSGEGAP